MYKSTLSHESKVIVKKSLNDIENNIQKHVLHSTEAAMFRSKCEWVQCGEVSSKMFFSLEKQNYLNKNMKCVYHDNGQITYDQKEILNEQTRFFRKLYTADGRIHFNIKKEATDPSVNESQKSTCDRELTDHELYNAIMMMKAIKIGGPDGLSAEFYKRFYYYLKTLLLQMYHYAYINRKLPLSTHSGLITLLPKKNKDTKYIKNTRPLTMLDLDYKILAKIMDNRIKEVLPHLIHQDQTGFMANQNISWNIKESLLT